MNPARFYKTATLAPATLPVSYDKPDLFFKGRDSSGMSLGRFWLFGGRAASFTSSHHPHRAGI